MDMEEEIHHALKNGDVIIYGAHLVALELYRYMKSVSEELELCFAFAGFVVTGAEENPQELEGHKVIEIQNSQAPRTATMMIAMPEKYHHEVECCARQLGFLSFVRVGLKAMSKLKGRQVLRYSKAYEKLGFYLCEDTRDVSWLNCYLYKGAVAQEYSSKETHFKFPTLYYLDRAELYGEMEQFDFCKEYERLFGPYRNIHTLPVHETFEEIGHQLNVYMVFSQWDSAADVKQEFPEWIRAIHAGSILADKKTGSILDETGDSISGENRMLAEMTAAYWIWKNAESVKYKGLCHYRRHFLLNRAEVQNLECNGVDVILTTPRYVPGGIRQMFLKETPVKEPVYQIMQRAVAQCHPEDAEAFAAYMEERLYCPNNMVIAKSTIYDAYCEWIFSVLFRMMEMEKESGYGHEQDRHMAYAAELLTSYFFTRCKKYHVAVTDYEFYG